MANAPSPLLRIERLTPAHDLEHFESSNSTLDAWLKRYALVNQRAESAKTYVAHRGSHVAGFYSLVAGSILKDETPRRIAQGLANQPVGVILLARLAVDKNEQGKGLGKALLRDALARIAQAADVVGVRAVLVHAIDENARKFYLHHGFEPTPMNAMHLMMLMKDLRASI